MTQLRGPFNTMPNGRTKLIGILALVALLATAVSVAWPALLQAQSERTLNLSSLTVTDENGTTIDMGTFAASTTSYSASVASTVEQVTVTARPESSSGVYVHLTPTHYGPGDSGWEVEG